MGRQIIKQPNGKYCIFSSIVDNVTHYDMTEKDIVKENVSEYKKKIIIEVKEIIEKLEAGSKPYLQSTLSYDDMLGQIKEIHGKKESEEVKKTIENHGKN